MNRHLPLAVALALCVTPPLFAADRPAAPVFRPETRPAPPPALTRPAFQPRPADPHQPATGHPRPRNDRSLDLFIRGDESRGLGPDRR